MNDTKSLFNDEEILWRDYIEEWERMEQLRDQEIVRQFWAFKFQETVFWDIN